MSRNSVPTFDRTIEKTNRWLSDLQQALGVAERQQAYLALRAVLHTLRDRIPLDEAAQLAAQLPMLIRGLYYEGWDPSREPRKYRHKRDFLEQIHREAPALAPATLEFAVTSVFGLLAAEISHGETEQVRALLPPEVRELWPKPGL
jgi:uncharacterized protein (DUF2267 family)